MGLSGMEPLIRFGFGCPTANICCDATKHARVSKTKEITGELFVTR
jgi:hypothetical protein